MRSCFKRRNIKKLLLLLSKFGQKWPCETESRESVWKSGNDIIHRVTPVAWPRIITPRQPFQLIRVMKTTERQRGADGNSYNRFTWSFPEQHGEPNSTSETRVICVSAQRSCCRLLMLPPLNREHSEGHRRWRLQLFHRRIQTADVRSGAHGSVSSL